ncbi:MAG TPA: hypothetical protein VN363_00070 [Anaerolineales bacterium]|nr:hypothetical protein [Anaerolineales bacterium]
MNQEKSTLSSKNTGARRIQRLAAGLLILVLFAAAYLNSFYSPISALADAGGWPSPTFVIIPTINFPTATLFPTVDLSNLNQLLITEPTPTATLFIVPTPGSPESRSALSYLCLPLGVGILLILILVSLMVMRRRQE